MTLAIGEFVASLLVAFLFGGVVAAMWMAEGLRDADRRALEAKRDGEMRYIRGVSRARAQHRDAFSLLPRLHCSRSVSGHVRVSDVERLLAEPNE